MWYHPSKRRPTSNFRFFDKDKDKMINFTEFLVSLRGVQNDRRQAIIDKAFLKFDKEETGLIDVTEIRQFIIAQNIRKLLVMKWVKSDFLVCFNVRNNPGKIDRKEWNDYYSAVSYSIDNDDHFVIMMKTTWNLD